VLTEEIFNKVMRNDTAFTDLEGLSLESVAADSLTVRLAFDPRFLRPGGTVSGPTLFSLIDMAMWFLAFNVTGNARLAVTTDLTLHFLRPSKDKDMLAHVTTLRRGRRLMVMDCEVMPEGETDPMCRATGTYALPPAKTDSATGAKA
jgi:uncharacterized protein (TIGR00369 family)